MSLTHEAKNCVVCSAWSGGSPDGFEDPCFERPDVFLADGHNFRCMESCGIDHSGDHLTPVVKISLHAMYPIQQSGCFAYTFWDEGALGHTVCGAHACP